MKCVQQFNSERATRLPRSLQTWWRNWDSVTKQLWVHWLIRCWHGRTNPRGKTKCARCPWGFIKDQAPRKLTSCGDDFAYMVWPFKGTYFPYIEVQFKMVCLQQRNLVALPLITFMKPQSFTVFFLPYLYCVSRESKSLITRFWHGQHKELGRVVERDAVSWCTCALDTIS